MSASILSIDNTIPLTLLGQRVFIFEELQVDNGVRHSGSGRLLLYVDNHFTYFPDKTDTTIYDVGVWNQTQEKLGLTFKEYRTELLQEASTVLQGQMDGKGVAIRLTLHITQPPGQTVSVIPLEKIAMTVFAGDTCIRSETDKQGWFHYATLPYLDSLWIDEVLGFENWYIIDLADSIQQLDIEIDHQDLKRIAGNLSFDGNNGSKVSAMEGEWTIGRHFITKKSKGFTLMYRRLD